MDPLLYTERNSSAEDPRGHAVTDQNAMYITDIKNCGTK